MGTHEAVGGSDRTIESRRWSADLISRRGPIVVAVGLAVLSIPVVTIALLLAPEAAPRLNVTRLALGEAVALAAIATISAAVVGGAIGGFVIRSRRSLGVLAAIALAWPVGVAVVPIAASALGIRFQAVEFCIDGCNPMIRSDVPLSGAQAYFQSAVVSAATVVPLLGVLLLRPVARALDRRGAFTMASIVIVAAYATLNWVIVSGGVVAFLPFVALAIGVVLWSRLIEARA